jgi:2-isopropylmalate synthase
MEDNRYFSLNYQQVVSGTTVVSVASVEVKIGDEFVRGHHSGDGPIDAIFNAINAITETESKLKDFSVNALTDGTNARGEVTVRLQEGDIVATGKAVDRDILIASGKAYIDGLNRLEFAKNNLKKERISSVMVAV